mgnify:FL=1
MKRGNRPELIWGIGLTPAFAEEIAAAMGAGYHLRNHAMDALPRRRDTEKETPLVVFVAQSVWKKLPEQTARMLREWESPQRALILDVEREAGEFEDLTGEGFLTAVGLPLTPKKIRDVIFRAKEVKSLYDDIFRMTREIMLERELLSRKTDLLLFLNRFLARTVESLDQSTILIRAKEDLGMLFPIRALHAAIWGPGVESSIEAELFLDADLPVKAEEGWLEYLIAQTGKLAGGTVSGYQINYLSHSGQTDQETLFDASRIILLPLRVAGSAFGCLAIDGGKDRPLGKDQVDALNAAVNHMSLAMRNAVLFHEVKTRADHDGLTRIHNRQAFDERLVDELRRHQRYQHHLSLLMLDLDFFKSINDSYGHLAGDHVLREVGRILNESLRSTDFGARYGGEEFAIILPQTAEDQAWVLAERLRRKIESVPFEYEGQNFQVTASIGVATLRPGSLVKRKALLRQADESLYHAKKAGRNMVFMSKLETQQEAV